MSLDEPRGLFYLIMCITALSRTQGRLCKRHFYNSEQAADKNKSDPKLTTKTSQVFGATDTDLAVPSQLLADRTIRLFTLHKSVQVQQHGNLLSLLCSRFSLYDCLLYNF